MTSAMRKAAITVISLLILLRPALRAQKGTIMPTPAQIAFNATGQIVSGGCVWTYTAGTTTAAATYVDVNLTTPNANPIITGTDGKFTAYLVPGQSYKFQYEQACTPPAHGASIKTVDNIAATPTTSNNTSTLGTAAQTLSAGTCAYLSDGSGGRTTGQWYPCDSANPYSSTTVTVGMVPTQIAAAASGTILLNGSVTGLTSLSVGAVYYVGTSGAITPTAPSNRRVLGQADTAASLVLGPGDTNPPQTVFANDFRLSLTTATCVTTSDVTAATTLYWTPCTGNRVTLFDANGNPNTLTSAEISIAVPATTSQMYDVWVFNNAGTPALELLAWTNDTTPAVGVTRTSGRYTKSGDSTRLYVGSFRTTTVSGQTEDSKARRYVANYYNVRRRPLRVVDVATSWTYTTNTWRQANGNTANLVDVVIGHVNETALWLAVTVGSFNAAANNDAEVGIGEDSTTAPASELVGGTGLSTSPTIAGIPISAYLAKLPAIGRHAYNWIEKANASGGGGTTTWVGSSNGVASGISGWIEG